MHENYDSPVQYANDIALLFLSNPFVLNEWVQVVALPPQEQQTAEDVIVSGWGSTTSGGPLSNVLHWVQIPVVNDSTCSVNYEDEIILPSMLCAGFSQGGKDSCSGDSGGPLVTVASKYLAGIVSWGYGKYC